MIAALIILAIDALVLYGLRRGQRHRREREAAAHYAASEAKLRRETGALAEAPENGAT